MRNRKNVLYQKSDGIGDIRVILYDDTGKQLESKHLGTTGVDKVENFPATVENGKDYYIMVYKYSVNGKFYIGISDSAETKPTNS